mgnify:CR=1 FL=1
MPTFASTKSNVAYLSNGSQPLGALNTGMGYAPDIDPATVTESSFIGGAVADVKYQAGAVSQPVAEPETVKAKAKK